MQQHDFSYPIRGKMHGGGEGRETIEQGVILAKIFSIYSVPGIILNAIYELTHGILTKPMRSALLCSFHKGTERLLTCLMPHS